MSRNATPELIAYFGSAKATLAFNLYTISLNNGLTLRITNADRSMMTTDGRVFAAGRGIPIMERSKLKWQRGVQTDTMKLTMRGDASVLIGNVPLVPFAVSNGFSGASVLLERAFVDLDLQLRGTLIWFAGVVGEVEPTRYGVELQVRDDLSKLSLMMPQNLYQAQCVNTLYGPVCTVNADLFRVNLSVSVIDANNPTGFVRAVFGGKPPGWFDLGRFTFTSGENVGVSRTVRASATDGTVTDFRFARPFPLPIAPTDTFTVWAGCDRTQNMCGGKFDNNAFVGGRFKATPYVPDATTVT